MGYEVTLLTSIGIAVLFALSLNIILGFCGQISLGHAAFFGIGAYTSASFAGMGLPVEVALLPAMAMAAMERTAAMPSVPHLVTRLRRASTRMGV